MASRILVTGGAGFIGASVVRTLLHRGHEVVVLDSGIAAGFGLIDGTGAMVVNADLRDQAAVQSGLEGCESVIHLAAQVSVPLSIADPVADLAVNVEGSIALLEAARTAGIQRIVFASSNAVIGGQPSPANEELVPSPVSPYGAAKAAIEAYLAAYGAAYGLDGVALRFANAYGPWSAHKSSVSAAFIKAYLRGGPLLVNGTGAQTRDFVYVDDIASMILCCLEAPSDQVAGQIFQVGTGHETSLLELAQTLFEVGGHEVPIQHAEPSPGDVARNFSDISKARRVLGWSPVVDLRDGMDRTLHWFRENWREG